MLHYPPIKALLAGALMLAGSATFAQTTQQPVQLVVSLYPTKQVEKICLAIEKQPNIMALVQLLSPTGEELYWAQLPKKEAKVHQLFDLNELEDGTYTICIKQGKEVIVKLIQLQTTAPKLTESARHLTLGN